jgi:hypothetical protein
MDLMFCRYCGAHILEDSLFCAKCGKRLGRRANPRLEKLVTVLHLNTPYPYFGILLLMAVVWAVTPHRSSFDYSQTKWSIEMDRKLDVPDDNLYRESLSVVVENTGKTALRYIPVEVHARIEPQKTADVMIAFPGDRESIIEGGKPRPVVVVLTDSTAAGAKRRYALDANVTAARPFKVTLDVLQDDGKTLLASYVLER